MFKKKAIIALLALLLPFTAMAGLSANDLPGNAQWYFFADINAIKKAESGAVLYAWLEDEVFTEVKEETGIDIGQSINSVTAYANEDGGFVGVVDGKISDESRDKILAVGAVEGGMELFTFKGKTYYRVNDNDHDKEAIAAVEEAIGPIDDEEHHGHNGNNFDIDTDEVFFSFAIDNKILLSSTAARMEQLLADNGRLKHDKKNTGALFVMTAENSFVQAGMQPDKFADSADFDSNVIRNAKQVGLLISDQKGQMAVEAQLVTTEPAMAESLGNIVRGLISLQAFNNEVPPELSAIITSTKVTVSGATLSIKTLFDPKTVIEMLNAAD